MSGKHWMVLVIIVISVFSLNPVLAATKVRVHARNMGHVKPGSLSSSFGLGHESSLEIRHELRLRNGNQLARMRQKYKGIPVYGRSVAVERDERGNVIKADGLLEHGLERKLPIVTPRLTPSQASRALQKSNSQLRLPVRGAKAKLFVYANGKSQDRARLVYRVSYLVGKGNDLARPTALIDADTGKVIKKWNGLADAQSSGGSYVYATGLGGNQKTGVYWYDNQPGDRGRLWVYRYQGVCYSSNPRVAVYDMGNKSNDPNPPFWTFDCSSNDSWDWYSSGDGIYGAYSPVDDALRFAGDTYDMYEDWFGESPLVHADGTPMKIVLWVHYGNDYENGSWIGTGIILGDGRGVYYYPFVALDFTAHEVSHGFTEQHSGLEYVDQSGGMNEAFSDMAAASVSYYKHGVNPNNFIFGETIVRSSAYNNIGAFRSLCDPSSNGYAIDDAANYYGGMDPHYSSGVYNKAFCTLAKTNGWNIKKAFEVFHDANAYYWGPQETFDGGACGVESAADDRGFSKSDVVAAFAVVGVTCQSGGSSSTTSSPASPSPSAPGHGPVHQRPVYHQKAQATRPLDTGLL